MVDHCPTELVAFLWYLAHSVVWLANLFGFPNFLIHTQVRKLSSSQLLGWWFHQASMETQLLTWCKYKMILDLLWHLNFMDLSVFQAHCLQIEKPPTTYSFWSCRKFSPKAVPIPSVAWAAAFGNGNLPTKSPSCVCLLSLLLVLGTIGGRWGTHLLSRFFFWGGV